jgi:hypothetical protein
VYLLVAAVLVQPQVMAALVLDKQVVAMVLKTVEMEILLQPTLVQVAVVVDEVEAAAAMVALVAAVLS